MCLQPKAVSKPPLCWTSRHYKDSSLGVGIRRHRSFVCVAGLRIWRSLDDGTACENGRPTASQGFADLKGGRWTWFPEVHKLSRGFRGPTTRENATKVEMYSGCRIWDLSFRCFWREFFRLLFSRKRPRRVLLRKALPSKTAEVMAVCKDCHQRLPKWSLSLKIVIKDCRSDDCL